MAKKNLTTKPKNLGGAWWKKNGKGVPYRGFYIPNRDGERTFVLTGLLANGKPDSKSFESWQMAVQLGWQKID